MPLLREQPLSVAEERRPHSVGPQREVRLDRNLRGLARRGLHRVLVAPDHAVERVEPLDDQLAREAAVDRAGDLGVEADRLAVIEEVEARVGPELKVGEARVGHGQQPRRPRQHRPAADEDRDLVARLKQEGPPRPPLVHHPPQVELARGLAHLVRRFEIRLGGVRVLPLGRLLAGGVNVDGVRLELELRPPLLGLRRGEPHELDPMPARLDGLGHRPRVLPAAPDERLILGLEQPIRGGFRPCCGRLQELRPGRRGGAEAGQKDEEQPGAGEA